MEESLALEQPIAPIHMLPNFDKRERLLLKKLLARLMESPLAKTDNIVYRTAKGLLLRLMK